MHDLPQSTLRDLAAVLAAVAAALFRHAARLMARLRVVAEPPDDLRVSSSRGASYSGGIVIDDNEVIGGIVVRVGERTPVPPQRVLVPADPYDRDDRRDDRQFLKGWATDPREEDDQWPRRR